MNDQSLASSLPLSEEIPSFLRVARPNHDPGRECLDLVLCNRLLQILPLYPASEVSILGIEVVVQKLGKDAPDPSQAALRLL